MGQLPQMEELLLVNYPLLSIYIQHSVTHLYTLAQTLIHVYDYIYIIYTYSNINRYIIVISSYIYIIHTVCAVFKTICRPLAGQ